MQAPGWFRIGGPATGRRGRRPLSGGSDDEDHRAQLGQRLVETFGPRPSCRQVQRVTASRTGHAPWGSQVAPAQGVGGDEALAQANAADPAGQVVGHDVEPQPGGVGAESTRGEVVEAHPVLEVSDGVFDHGVSTVVGLELEGVAISISDEAVVGVADQQGELGPWCRPAPGGR